MDEEIMYWVGLNAFPGIGPVRFSLLYTYFGTAKNIWEAPEKTLLETNLPHTLVTSFVHFRKTFNIRNYIHALAEQHIGVLTKIDPRYPRLLKEIADAPILLYIKGRKGDRPIDMERTIAIVGTRRPTSYGIEMTKTIVSDLVASGITIVSGMAYGIDAVAQTTAIREGGKTIAVLGCGVDICAPAANRFIYDACTTGGYGAVISEMPLSIRPNKGLFPARNRIISGLSRAVVVIEGADNSGSLITARNAAEQGREVFAVPGPATSLMSKGPSKLIKSGAELAESADDILSGLGLAKFSVSENNKKTSAANDNTPNEQKLLDIIGQEPTHIDTLITRSGLTAGVVAATITVLELKRRVKDIGGKVYATNNR